MRQTLLRLVVLVVAIVVTAPAVEAQDRDERILRFHSDITVDPDGTMEVRETIRVRAAGDEIRRGIYRDFPTRYRDRYGNRVVVTFDVVGVLRDGSPEPWFTEGLDNGVRVYFGSESVFLDPGVYTYALTYRTSRQLGFFDEHDELYWNVTGNGWGFPVDDASATIRLPGAIDPATVETIGFTGPEGSTEQDYEATVTAGPTVAVRATRALARSRGSPWPWPGRRASSASPPAASASATSSPTTGPRSSPPSACWSCSRITW